MLDIETMKPSKIKNKLYTKSYFIKRLVEAGFKVGKLSVETEGEKDYYWRIVVSPNDRDIVVTCYKPEFGEYYFTIVANSRIKVMTHSMDVIIEHLEMLHADLTKIGVAIEKKT